MRTFNLRFNFYNSDKLCEKAGDRRSLFCYAKRHSSVWISNVILKESVGCWYIQLFEGYLSMSKKSFQVWKVKVCKINIYIKNEQIKINKLKWAELHSFLLIEFCLPVFNIKLQICLYFLKTENLFSKIKIFWCCNTINSLI